MNVLSFHSILEVLGLGEGSAFFSVIGGGGIRTLKLLICFLLNENISHPSIYCLKKT